MAVNVDAGLDRPRAAGRALVDAPSVDGAPSRDPSDLWDEYLACRTIEARNKLARHYAPLLRAVATRMMSGRTGYVDVEDLEAYGFFGLCDAIERFDPSRENAFATLAVPRIRGSIIDHLRALDPASRTVRSGAKLLDLTTDTLVLELRRQPNRAELAAEIGVSVERVEGMQVRARVADAVSLDQPAYKAGTTLAAQLPSVEGPEVSLELMRSGLKEAIAQAITRLRPKEAHVVVEHWFKGRRYAEIAADLGVTESRVCQLHSAALRTLRTSTALAAEYFD